MLPALHDVAATGAIGRVRLRPVDQVPAINAFFESQALRLLAGVVGVEFTDRRALAIPGLPAFGGRAWAWIGGDAIGPAQVL